MDDDSVIEKRCAASAIAADRVSDFIVSEMQRDLDVDPSYVIKKKDGLSNAQKLLKGKSLRDVFLLKEILNRPYD